jgi:hypothetical protein
MRPPWIAMSLGDGMLKMGDTYTAQELMIKLKLASGRRESLE